MSTDQFLRSDQRLVRVQIQDQRLVPVRVQAQIQVQYEYQEQDIEYTGRKLNYELKKGPIEYRQLKNRRYLVAFVAMWAAILAFSISSIGKGNLQDMFKPYDSQNRQCGNGDLINYPFIYMINEVDYYCVYTCPTKDDLGKPLPCFQCPSIKTPYPSRKYRTMCQPTQDADPQYKKLAQGEYIFDMFKDYSIDIREGLPIILGSIGLSFFFSFSILLLMRSSPGFVVWGIIFIIFLLFETVGGVSLSLYYGYRVAYIPIYEDGNPITLLIEGYGSCCVGVIVVIVALCLTKKIRLAICIMKAAATFVSQEFPIALVPLLMSTLVLGMIAYWAIFSTLIYAANTEAKKEIDDPYVQFETDKKSETKLLILEVGIMWTVCYLTALTNFVVGTSCCYWYYSHQGNSRKGSIQKGFRNGLSYNFGSLLYGAAIFPLIWAIKKALSQYVKLYKSIAVLAQYNMCYWLQFLYCKCYVKFFDKVIKFLDKNVYIIMALTGDDFCTSARDAFYLIYRNQGRVAFTQGVGAIFQILSVLFIVLASTSICFFIMLSEYFTFKDSNFILVLIQVISYFIAQNFMLLYGYGVDTILFCLIVDIEQNINEGGAKSIPPVLKKYASELF
ncbi:unnamed protein product (macronuclear) [Paramecium tetraurelia]|uniref:Choline transporter-like protein n=1 Tax=Paramecium tetraurelia TaxID=5888 RepID=A0BEE9_PARTE|nr:uncharacterized protein GSPATT00027949001 [Paramecium tetraurelia]CAK56916.1 unnamed protein product [Paramecium tetraurelia]|eukprot:XP_001424314.1 hypothetical protein (macronuclear) [Paramecium tetraurelia strain d4-2]